MKSLCIKLYHFFISWLAQRQRDQELLAANIHIACKRVARLMEGGWPEGREPPPLDGYDRA
jgi:hypothetical protein